MVAGRRRYPRSPAHARGRPPRNATLTASTPCTACPRARRCGPSWMSPTGHKPPAASRCPRSHASWVVR